MNNIKKAVKMYLKITIRPFFTSCGLFMLALVLLFFLTVDPTERNLWRLMIIMSCSNKLFGIYTLLFFGTVSMTGNKFFASLPFSKELFMKVHLLAVIGVAFVIDILIFVITAFRWPEGEFMNLLILLPIGSFMVNMTISTIGKQKIGILSLLGFIFVLLVACFPLSLLDILCIDSSVSTAAVIGALIYIVGFAITLLLNLFWWKHCDHVNAKRTVTIS